MITTIKTIIKAHFTLNSMIFIKYFLSTTHRKKILFNHYSDS